MARLLAVISASDAGAAARSSSSHSGRLLRWLVATSARRRPRRIQASFSANPDQAGQGIVKAFRGRVVAGWRIVAGWTGAHAFGSCSVVGIVGWKLSTITHRAEAAHRQPARFVVRIRNFIGDVVLLIPALERLAA